MKLKALLTTLFLVLGCTRQLVWAEETARNTVSSPVMVKINDHITEETSGAWIAQILAAAAKNDYVTIELDTPGGQNDVGFKLAKAIEECGKPTICIVDGEAQSFGFYLLQSCSIRAMTKRSFLMMHESHYVNVGLRAPNKHEFYAWYRSLQVTDDAMSEHYASRMGMPVEEIRRRIANKEWYFNWTDAKKYNAVDFVFESEREGITKLVNSLQK